MANQLRRELGLFGAVLMGLGSIIGTGIFVSVGIGAGIAGPAVIVAIVLAALLAACNGLNSAQLAASHPVSGGTYEYGYRYLNKRLGFTAGWLFLLAKSASAAAAALGFAGYLLNTLNLDHSLRVPLAVGAVIGLMMIVLSGLRRSNRLNAAVVTLTLLGLGALIVSGMSKLNAENFSPFFPPQADSAVGALLQAVALMFVAFTGYGRIATMGEEVRTPLRTIPRAVVVTLLVAAGLYSAVAFVGVGLIGAPALATAVDEGSTAPLQTAAQATALPFVEQLVTVSAITAMLGVLLNLILGLSRVLLAMSRRGDMPPVAARLNDAGTTPTVAVVITGAVVSLLALTGSVWATWSFSAFTVLLYYAITNLAALRLPQEARLFPRTVAWAGLGACLFLAFWVEQTIWLLGLALIAVGLIWQTLARRLWRTATVTP